MDPNLQAWWGPALAFAAGVVSFASPCVLPLVPGYLAFVSGQEGEAQRSIGQRLLPMALFVAGLTIVFTALGAFSSAVVPVIRSPVGQRIAGAVVIVIGVLMLLYAFRVGGAAVFAERRPFLGKVRPGTLGALPLGMAFATGWTPCVGPVLAGILGIAAAQGGGAWGAVLMAFYSLGLGLPFLLVGLGLRRLMDALGFVKRNYRWFAGVGGGLLVLIGLLLVTNLWLPFLSRLGLLRLVQGFEPPI
jgi:cytochrome c-type biogenesis protein